MSFQVDVGIVTVTYNSARVLPDFLASIQVAIEHCPAALHLYIVDNGSTDESIQIIKSAQVSEVTLIENNANLGVARGNNIGICQALSDGSQDVILINNDTVFAEDLIDSLLDPELHAVVPTIVAESPKDTLWFNKGTVSVLRCFRVTHVAAGTPMRAMHYEPGATTPYAPTCCMRVSRRLLQDVGLMDERFFVYGDDVDYCIRIRECGYAISVIEATLLHKVSAITGGGTSPFGSYHIVRSRVLLARKYLRGSRQVLAILYLIAWIMGRAIFIKEPPRILFLRLRALRDGLSAGTDQ